MTEELRVFLSCIYGEAAGCSPAAWKAIASVILNRVGVREWRKFKSPLRVIAGTGFDAFTHRNAPYEFAFNYFREDYRGFPCKGLDDLRKAVEPIYLKQALRTTDAELYYSPNAQASLHAKRPEVWPAAPRWNFTLLEEIAVPGTEGDDFKWFRYRTGKAVAA